MLAEMFKDRASVSLSMDELDRLGADPKNENSRRLAALLREAETGRGVSCGQDELMEVLAGAMQEAAQVNKP